MPKTWLSLPEAERLAVEITGLNVEAVRDEIREGCLNREIMYCRRDEGDGEARARDGGEWLNQMDWAGGGFVIPGYSPYLWASPDDWVKEKFVVVLIARWSLERYFAPARAAVKPERPAPLDGSMPPDGSCGTRTLSEKEVNHWLDQRAAERQTQRWQGQEVMWKACKAERGGDFSRERFYELRWAAMERHGIDQPKSGNPGKQLSGN
jgi:hypothetical protein